MKSLEQKYSRLFTILFITVLLTGLALRFYQFLMGRSLWEDEAHLALNFINRDFAGLMEPLDNIQAAPPLFLISVKCFNVVFGYGEKALRALPFVLSVLTLPLFYFIVRDLTKSRLAAIISFIAFSVNIALIYFSSELKTYGVDVAMWLVMVWLMVTQNQAIAKKLSVLLAIAGSIFALYSNVTFVLLFCIGCVFLFGWIRSRIIKRAEAAVLLIWSIVYIAYYYGFLYQHPYHDTQVSLYAFAFPPKNIFHLDFFEFIKARVQEMKNLLLYVSADYGFAWVLLFLFIVAIIAGFRQKKYKLLLFSLVPILLHLLLSYFRVYPFWYRFLLYTVPGLMMLMGWGVYVVAAFAAKHIHKIIGGAVVISCSLFFIVPSLQGFPLYYREIRPGLDYINKYHPSAKLYITTPLTLYKYYYQTGIAKDSFYEALEWNIDPEQYFESVAATQGDYLLLHAADTNVDGYGRVVSALRSKGLIKKEFSYRTYTVNLISALKQDGWVLTCNSFNKDRIFDFNGKKVTALWDNTPVISEPVVLPPGKYKMSILSKGTAAKGIFPHIHILVNNNEIGAYMTHDDYTEEQLDFVQPNDSMVLQFVMDNDLSDPVHNEDRNAFIQHIIIDKASEQ